MENSTNTTLNLTQINFPVFRLTTRPPQQEDSVLFYSTESYNLDTATYKQNIRIVDDKSIDAPTLGRRRLIIKAAGGSVYPINVVVYFLSDLIKLSKPDTWWIDNTGTYFNYKKSTRAKLRFYKIENCYVLPGMGAVLKLKGLPMRFKLLYKPAEDKTWAGVLHWDQNTVLYGVYDNFQRESWRLV